MYKTHTSCRACGYAKPGAQGIKSGPSKESLQPVFDLGLQPMANDFAAADEERAGYAPLKVMFCPRCTLAQLSVVVNPEILYSRYLYVTSQSDTMYAHFDALGEVLRKEQPFSSLLEIGSNDGTMLRFFARHGITVAGIDPAENLADQSRKFGIPTVTGVFNACTAQKSLAAFRSGFDVILARHVFCHVDDWAEFIDCLAIPSHKNTLIGIEAPYVKDLLDRGEFDTIYHEHLSYLSIAAMRALLADSPFRLHRIVRFPIHGGAILILLRRKDYEGPTDASVAEFEKEENITLESWQAFNMKAAANVNSLEAFVRSARKDGKRVVGFGASAKSTLGPWVIS